MKILVVIVCIVSFILGLLAAYSAAVAGEEDQYRQQHGFGLIILMIIGLALMAIPIGIMMHIEW